MLRHLLASALERAIVLADEPRIVHMGRRFRPSDQQWSSWDLLALGLGIAALAACVAVGVTAWRLARHYLATSPRCLFWQLCQAHGLKSRERRALQLLARHHALRQPGEIFLRQHLFLAQPNWPAPLQRDQELLNGLQGRLFSN